ncbi:MAG TPA: M1 family metallopeptidase [Longimicrobiaceae bacterium]|nr:M1 family metallopeptidase [Longimicrobiaceae bacterium]
MVSRAPLLALAAAMVAGGAMPAAAQSHGSVPDTSIFAPLGLWPSPNEIRTGAGAPGARYWQNRADYTLRATLDTATKTVRGEMRLRYTNHSPDSLRFIWVQTEQNAFKSGSLNSYYFPAGSRFGARGFEGGDVIERFGQVVGTRTVPLHLRGEGTVTKVDLAQPLAPGQTATFDVAWHFAVPEHGADRMGRDGPLYEIAQWYPRVNVYDDVHGWNTEPYLGQGEFYLDYGDYDVYVTVPAGYIVAGTGLVQNAAEVLTPAQISRLARAKDSATPVHIITLDELRSGAARPRRTGTQTWHFHADSVRDAVWAASPDFLWDASGWHGILAMAYYRPTAVDPWADAADQARMSIMEYSDRWFPYPWPQISAVEGPISGMEYPMVAMEAHSDDVFDLYNVVTHEIGHMWFPMIVGSNERTHFWQDEGFNTFINTFSEGRRYPQKGDQMARALAERQQIETLMGRGLDLTIEVPADRIDGRLLGVTEYTKPSVGLQLLRQEIMGPEAFDDAFRTYVRRWAFRHPTPADFFRTMEDVGGRRLDWFWREWFLENARFDQAVDSVQTARNGSTQHVDVAFGNRERGVLPIRARFTFSDGSTQEFHYPAEVWATNQRRYVRSYDFAGKTLTRIELDPEKRLVDVNRGNNVWTPRS